MSRIIVFPHTKILVGGMSFGPSQRLWEMVRALHRKGHDVTIAEKKRRRSETRDSIKFVSWNGELLENISKKFDVAILPIWCSDPDFLEALKNIPTVVDVTVPFLIEASDFFSTNYKVITAHQIKHFIDDIFIPSSLILSKGDLFLCANDRQRRYYLGILSMLGRINPLSYNQDLVMVIPTAVSSEKPRHTKKLIKGKVVSRDKKVILWPGSIFPWFDAITAIESMKVVSKKIPDAVMIFVGSINPRAPRSFTYKHVKKAKEKAEELGLLNKSLFFVDWLPYEDRANMYLESEFAVVTSKDNLENELAHRTRIIDCLWGKLPVICTEGDSISEIIERRGLGAVVKANDPKILAEKIITFLEDKTKLETISKKIDKFVQEELDWDKAIEPLHNFCGNPSVDPYKDKISPYTLPQYMKKRIDEKDKQLQEIFESRGWKFLTELHNVKKKLGLIK